MIIAFVSDSVYPYNKGGKEKRLYEMSTRMARLGHEVHIYTMHWWDNTDKQIVMDGITLHAISKKYDMYKGEKRSIKEGIMFGIACFKVFSIKADVIDIDHMPFFPIYSSWIALKLKNKKMFATWHESLSRKDWTDYMGWLGLISFVIEHISIKLPDHINVISKHTLESLATNHGRTHNLSLIPPGVDLKEVKKILPSKHTTDILYIGRLVKDKNVDILIDAVSLLANKKTDIKCLIVGHGVEEEKLKKKVLTHNLGSNIKFLKPLEKDADVYAYMKSSKVFVLPSTREGFGMVVLESLANDTPVVVIDSPSNASKYLVDEGVSGSIVQLDAKELCNSIDQWILNDKNINISESLQNYDWDNIISKQIEIYQS